MTDQTVHHDHYQYQADPNLSSAARYSPSNTIVGTTEYTTSVTYSNLVFVPNGRDGSYHHGNTNAESVTTLLDHSQAAYILSSDSRQYNTENKHTDDHHHHHQHHQQQHHQYNSDDQLIDGMTQTQHLNSVDNYHIQEEYVETTDGTEIILQGPNGEFYRQVQNVYLDDGNGGTSTVEIMPIIDGDQYVDNGSGQQQHYQSIFKVEEIHHHTAKAGNMVLHLPSVADAELLVNSSSSFGQYKSEYTVLEPMNRQLLPEAQQQYLVEISNHAEEGMRPVQSLTMDEKEQQRILLERTMSPLLAAVNDITARDEQLQDFLARSSFKEELMLEQSSNTEGHNHNYQPPTNYAIEPIPPQPAKIFPPPIPSNQASMQPKNQQQQSEDTSAGYSNDLKITNVRSVTNEYVDINDMEFVQHRTTGGEFSNNDTSHENLLVRRSQRRIKKPDDLMVSDKPVPSRAWASLPTAFLHITKGTLSTDDYNIFAKKDIPLRTKFGPYKGDIKTLTPNERTELDSVENRRLPLLLLDGLIMLDTSNEYTSNWMRFVRLANSFTEQNLLLFEIDQQLFFQTCLPIAPKQQLSVGYGQEYAERYGLPFLQPSAAEKVALFERWPCFECDQKFETFELLQTHLNAQHEECANGPNVSATPGKRPYTTKLNRTRRRRTVRSKLTARKVSGPTVRYACCYCSKVFSKLIGFKRHNELAHSFVDAEARNSVLTNSTKENAGKTNKCEVCRRYFSSTERLEKHRLMHCKSHESKLVQCTYCPKQVLTQSALAMHVKSHIFKSRLFHCLYCSERFQHATEIMGHVPIHMENGFYNCERCHKEFKEYTTVRKHFRSIHSNVLHSCPDCGREFKSMHKLKQHRLSHSDVREFLCSDCGKQFKRKDKLREHILSIHVKAAKKQEQELKQQQQQDHTLQITKEKTSSDDLPTEKESSNQQQCKPNPTDPLKPADVPISNAVSPSDYQRFIYKCHDCQLGFKRRGMLVNHMAKRHPQVSIDSVPELNLPILKAQRYYYCQYCDKVYKSSSKRKAHILKYHPGMDLPMSSRQKSGQPPEVPGLPNASYSETVGNVTTHPQRCAWCHKQYASKARLLQHQRKQHTEHLREIEMYNQQDMEFGVDGMPDESGPNDGYIDQHGHFLTTMPTRYLSNNGGYETENKLLKLSSAALEASLKDDFHFYDDKGATAASSTDIHQQSQHHNHHSSLDELGDAVLSKVDVNFKVVGTDYVDTTSSSGDLNRLPQLFDEIDYMTLKPVSVDHYHSDHHQNQHLHLHQQQQQHLVTPENPAKKLTLTYTHNTG